MIKKYLTRFVMLLVAFICSVGCVSVSGFLKENKINGSDVFNYETYNYESNLRATISSLINDSPLIIKDQHIEMPEGLDIRKRLSDGTNYIFEVDIVNKRDDEFYKFIKDNYNKTYKVEDLSSRNFPFMVIGTHQIFSMSFSPNSYDETDDYIWKIDADYKYIEDEMSLNELFSYHNDNYINDLHSFFDQIYLSNKNANIKNTVVNAVLYNTIFYVFMLVAMYIVKYYLIGRDDEHKLSFIWMIVCSISFLIMPVLGYLITGLSMQVTPTILYVLAGFISLVIYMKVRSKHENN